MIKTKLILKYFQIFSKINFDKIHVENSSINYYNFFKILIILYNFFLIKLNKLKYGILIKYDLDRPYLCKPLLFIFALDKIFKPVKEMHEYYGKIHTELDKLNRDYKAPDFPIVI